jgi:hypothetical protein
MLTHPRLDTSVLSLIILKRCSNLQTLQIASNGDVLELRNNFAIQRLFVTRLVLSEFGVTPGVALPESTNATISEYNSYLSSYGIALADPTSWH